MSHTLAVFHVLSAGIALLLASAIVASRPGRRHQRPRPSGRAARRFVATCWPLLGRLLWVVLLLVGRPVANRRYGLVEPVLRPFEEHLAAHNHRLPPATCVPIPAAPWWLLRCRACRAWVRLREVPARGGTGVDLQVVGGTLDGMSPCPARYVGGSHPASPAPATPRTRPPSVP